MFGKQTDDTRHTIGRQFDGIISEYKSGAGITPVCLFDQTIKSQNNQVGSQWICCRDSN